MTAADPAVAAPAAGRRRRSAAIVVRPLVPSSALILLGSAGHDPSSAFRDDVSTYGSSRPDSDRRRHAQPGRAPSTSSGVAVAIGFKMNLFNIGVEGQYRLAALIAAGVGAAVVAAGAASTCCSSSSWPCSSAPRGPASPACSRDPRRQRGDLDDHAQRHRHRARRATCSATASARRGATAPAPSAPSRSPSPAGFPALNGLLELRHRPAAGDSSCRASWSSPSSSASLYYAAGLAHPLRLRPAGDRRQPVGRRRPAASTRSG